MPKKRRVYISRVVGNQVMTSADLERLHKYMLEIEESLDLACTPTPTANHGCFEA